ncbi:TPA: hypothetical protein HA251_08615 [Candidatus Woesearchaeota archaeon]|nr:hypothetical protein [Candidatus Woesearchaeota archaeon]
MDNHKTGGIYKALDDRVRAWYTKKTLAYEEKGGNRYNLARGLGITSMLTIPGFVAASDTAGTALADGYYNIAFLTSIYDIIDSDTRKETSRDTIESGQAIEYNPLENGYERFCIQARLPIIIGGIGTIGTGAVMAVDGLLHRDSGQLSSAMPCFLAGMQMLALASSYYIKDIDPKLLKKEREETPITTPALLEEKI